MKVEFGCKGRIGKQGLYLGGKTESGGSLRVVEGAHAHAIAREEYLLVFAIPDCKGPLSVEVMDALFALVLVQMKDDFSVGGSCEAVTALFESVSQFEVVEDLAIEGDGESSVTAGHRLMATDNVDDTEARMAEADMAIGEDSAIIGSTVSDRCDHGRNEAAVSGTCVRIQDAAYAAHFGALLSGMDQLRPWSSAKVVVIPKQLLLELMVEIASVLLGFVVGAHSLNEFLVGMVGG